jgi:ABC-2 type transport system ATP-binding protein
VPDLQRRDRIARHGLAAYGSRPLAHGHRNASAEQPSGPHEQRCGGRPRVPAVQGSRFRARAAFGKRFVRPSGSERYNEASRVPGSACLTSRMYALSARGLVKTYRNGVEALRGIDLDVEQGDFFALLGPNGAGKTTLIGIVTSLVTKTSGEVTVFGHDLDRELEFAKSCIGVVPQELNFNQFESSETIVVNQAGFYGIARDEAKARAEKYLKQLDLWDKRKKISRTLSGGMKRRLMIARALMHEPRLLILDEPTAGVDIEIRRSMWDFLRDINERGTTIILTTHYLEEAETLCRNIAIIDGGRIVERDQMDRLLRKLHTEAFVLDLRHPLAAPPDLAGIDVELADPQTLEIEISKDQSLNEIFARLSAQGIEVLSMRNKVNRLEEIFMRLVDKGHAANGVAPAHGRARGGHP